MLRKARARGILRALLLRVRQVGYRWVTVLQICTMMWHRQHSTYPHHTKD